MVGRCLKMILKNCIRAWGEIAGDRDAWKLMLESKNTHGPESVEMMIYSEQKIFSRFVKLNVKRSGKIQHPD